jgi:hypothetical protein
MDWVTLLQQRGDVLAFLIAFILAQARGVVRWGFQVDRELALKDQVAAIHEKRADRLEAELKESGVERARANNDLLDALRLQAERLAGQAERR